MAGEAPGKKVDPTSKRYDADKIRTIVARVVWLIFVLCALALALAALLYAVEARPENNLVNIIYDVANAADLNFFGIDDPIREFSENGEVDLQKTALFNYGIGAILYLIVGRIVEKLIHP